MKKYKIIKESNGNGEAHYELWFEYKFLWKSYWCSVKERRLRYSFTKQWTNEQAIYDWMRGQEITRTVVKEGTVE